MLNLRTKILSVAAALVLLSQMGTVTVVLLSASRDVEQRAAQSLASGIEVLRKAASSRATDFETTVKAIAADYGLKQAVGLGDAPTIRSAMENHAQRAGADLAFLVGEDGRLIATSEFAADFLQQDYAIPAEFAEPTGRRSLIIRDQAYEIYTVAIRAPQPIAWMTMGFQLNDAYTRQLKDLVNLDVTLVAIDDAGPTPLASSAGKLFLQNAISEIFREVKFAAPGEVEVDGEGYLVMTGPLFPGDKNVYVLVTKSLAEAMAPYDLLKTASFALGALPLLVALLGAVLLSRAITQPVRALMEAASRIQAGNYATPVDIRSGDELSQFGVAFNAMQAEIATREEQISFQATHDQITGLHNANWLLNHLKTQINAAQAGDKLVLMLVSLNARSDIAGTLGHDIERAYLQQAAKDVSRFIDSSFVVARLEDDTFAVLFREDEARHARYVARDLGDRLRNGIRLPAVNVAINPAIGLAVYPTHARTAEQLMQRATIARREATVDGRSIRFYREGDEESLVRNMQLLQGLRDAASDNQFQLYCQPKIDLRNESVAGVEALIRWDHPDYGWLTPDSFIPLIEHSGNISVLTRWILERAVAEQKIWRDHGLDLTVAVNFSARDLLDPELPWFVIDLVKQQNCKPEKLVIEITEEAMVRDFDQAIGVMERLHGLGIRLAIDDFGTGYSSLEQLKHLPVDQIKIDKSFVAGIPDDSADIAIVSAVVDLARRLNLEIVAEGVENRAAMRWLMAHGVTQAQGFYWSKPVAAQEIAGWIADYSRGSSSQARVLELL